MSERIFDGRRAFEELLHPQSGQPSALDVLLSSRQAADQSLLKVAHLLSPDDPLTEYERLGGAYTAAGVKVSAAPAPKLSGGLKPGVNLFPHQREAVDKVLAKDGNLLLSHPVGSGKTLTAIAAFEELRKQGKAERALIVAPASLRTNFLENGIKKFTTSRGAIFGNAQEAEQGTHVTSEKPDPHAQYHVVSYELFRVDPKKYIDAAKADTVIYDELHRAKNEGVLTSKAIKDARQHHRNFIGLTGSIVSNTPADIVPLVDAMTDGNHLLGNKTTFESRFVQEHEDRSKTLKNPQVLRALLSPYVHHVDQKTLDTKAPQKRIEEVHVEMSPHQTQLYRFLTNQLDPITKIKLQAGMSHLNNATLNDMFAKMIRLRQVSNSVHTMDTRLSPEQSAKDTPKIKKVLDDVEDHLRDTKDGQVVIHTNLVHGGVDVVTAGLKSRGIDHAIFIGKGNPGVTEKARQQGVKEFQAGQKKVIVLSAAGGEGLDLPNTTFMAMVDGHFNPERINQAEARGVRAGGQSHRPEEQRQVLVRRYLSVLPQDLGRKTDVLQKVWSNVSPTQIKARIDAGAPAFFNPFKKDPTSDEWVYSIAKRKSVLNRGVHETIKTSSAPGCLSTHEEFEELMFPTMEKNAWRSADSGLVGAGIGALAGGGYGALLGGTPPRSKREAELDPNAPLRNRISSAVGGTISGALAGYQGARMFHENLDPTMLYGPAVNFLYGPMAGRAVADLFAPKRTVPKSVQELLGSDKTRYSDKALFEKYWEKFGPELETSGLKGKVSDPELEAKFTRALKDLYTEAATVKPTLSEQMARTDSTGKMGPKPSKTRFLVENALVSTLLPAGIGTVTGIGAAMRNELKGMAGSPTSSEHMSPVGHGVLAALPLALGTTANALKAYRDMYVDPGVETTSSKADTRKRSKFTDEQLQLLLRGMNVDEIKTKSHFIK